MPASTLTEGMAELTATWKTLTDGVLQGDCAFWIGSGISREKFPNVSALLLELLKILHSSSNPADSNCPFRKSLERIMALTPITDLSVSDHPDTWPDARKEELITLLASQYSDVLEQDVRLPTGILRITWDLLKLQEKYSDTRKDPDAEHRFIALLMEEGIISEILTTNWDALIEIAHEHCRGAKPANLQSVACATEWPRNGARNRVIKIHGCARKSFANSAKYRQFLVATRTEIQNWTARSEPFRTAFKAILREKIAFLVGLSAQDWNIQEEVAQVSFGQDAFFPIAPPKIYFAETSIRNSQRIILKAIYGQEAYDQKGDQIDGAAAVKMFGKTLFGSFYLLMLKAKIEFIKDLANPPLTSECTTMMDSILHQQLAELVAKYDAVPNELDRWRAVADEVPYFLSRLLSMFRRRAPLANRQAYEPIGDRHLGQLGDSAHEFSDLKWLLFALSFLREGVNRTLWHLSFPTALDGRFGQLLLSNGTNSAPVFLLKDDIGLVALLNSGFIDMTSPARHVVVYPGERRRGVTRVTSPTRAFPGSSTVSEPLEIWLRGELEDAASLGALFNVLQQEIALALVA